MFSLLPCFLKLLILAVSRPDSGNCHERDGVWRHACRRIFFSRKGRRGSAHLVTSKFAIPSGFRDYGSSVVGGFGDLGIWPFFFWVWPFHLSRVWPFLLRVWPFLLPVGPSFFLRFGPSFSGFGPSFFLAFGPSFSGVGLPSRGWPFLLGFFFFGGVGPSFSEFDPSLSFVLTLEEGNCGIAREPLTPKVLFYIICFSKKKMQMLLLLALVKVSSGIARDAFTKSRALGPLRLWRSTMSRTLWVGARRDGQRDLLGGEKRSTLATAEVKISG